MDFILGDKDLAIEIKASSRTNKSAITNLPALLDDGPVKKCYVICLDKQPRRLHNNVESIPWQMFIEKLWDDGFKL